MNYWALFQRVALGLLLMVAAGGVLVYMRNQQTSESMGGGYGGQEDRGFNPVPRKQLMCYSDDDCPENTQCAAAGVCIPAIISLPKQAYQQPKDPMQGRGRGKEKQTG